LRLIELVGRRVEVGGASLSWGQWYALIYTQGVVRDDESAAAVIDFVVLSSIPVFGGGGTDALE
jgi:hypothetical protein